MTNYVCKLKVAYIWKNRFSFSHKEAYQNYQNFAYLLYRRIHVSEEEDLNISDEERKSWKKFPGRATQLKRASGRSGRFGLDGLAFWLAVWTNSFCLHGIPIWLGAQWRQLAL
jgi:hypothetical protein